VGAPPKVDELLKINRGDPRSSASNTSLSVEVGPIEKLTTLIIAWLFLLNVGDVVKVHTASYLSPFTAAPNEAADDFTRSSLGNSTSVLMVKSGL